MVQLLMLPAVLFLVYGSLGTELLLYYFAMKCGVQKVIIEMDNSVIKKILCFLTSMQIVELVHKKSELSYFIIRGEKVLDLI